MPNKKGMVVCVDIGEGVYLVENTGYLIHVLCNMFWQRHQISLYMYAKKTAVLCLALLTIC